MEVPITPQQYAILSAEKQKAAAAQERVNLVLGTILGGHGITEGNVTQVAETAITLADAPVSE